MLGRKRKPGKIRNENILELIGSRNENGSLFEKEGNVNNTKHGDKFLKVVFADILIFGKCQNVVFYVF